VGFSWLGNSVRSINSLVQDHFIDYEATVDRDDEEEEEGYGV
jgi:hypothetical protein